MRLARFSADGPDWALIDEREGLLRHVGGGLNVWGPRIAGGEGSAALPMTGRLRPAANAVLDLRPLLRRILDLPLAGGPPGPRIAAVLGAPLEGRRNPFRSVLGYLLLDEQHRSRVLVTREEFGDEPPRTVDDLPSAPGLACKRMWQLDTAWGLKPGDVVVLGTPDMDAHMVARLAGTCRATTLSAGPATSAPGGRLLGKPPRVLSRPPRTGRVIPSVDGPSALPRVIG